MVWMMLLAWVLAPSTCRVHVEGMPVPQMRHHQVRVGVSRYQGAPLLEVDASAGSVAVLDGDRYGGRVELGASCSNPLVLHAHPLPATVSFASLPAEAVVSCENCGWPEDQAFLPKHLPVIVVDRWSTTVSFEIKAAGYEPLRVRHVVHPGPNLVTAQLARRIR